MTTAIEVSRLRYAYDAQDGGETHIVFDGLDLSVRQGSFVAILGHNGCGKSTLAKHFNAVLLPSGGSVHVYGMDTKDEEQLLAIRQHVGMVFQNPDNQIVSNVVEEDVAFAPENLGVPSEEIRRRVDDALRAVGMYEYRTYAPQLLSGGQKQRVAIAGVLAMQPQCVVLSANLIAQRSESKRHKPLAEFFVILRLFIVPFIKCPLVRKHGIVNKVDKSVQVHYVDLHRRCRKQ